jgi:hypothetical protein
MNIYTLPNVPGATETTEWTAFCHRKEPFIVIDHSTLRQGSLGGWLYARKWQFSVSFYTRSTGARGFNRGHERWFPTLAKAQAFAAKLAIEREINGHPPA